MKETTANSAVRIELARQLISQRRWPEAENCLREALDLEPKHVPARLQLVDALTVQDQYREALSQLSWLHRAAPRLAPEQDLELIRRLRRYNQSADIQERASRMPPPANLSIPVLLGLAAVLSSLNDQRSALTLLDEAVRGDPDYAPSRISRAQVLGYFGRFEEARKDLTRGLRQAPDSAQGMWLLARLTDGTNSGGLTKRLRQCLNTARNDNDRAYLGFALHKLLHDNHDHDEAWKALAIGCEAKRARLQYSAAAATSMVNGLIEVCDTAWLPAAEPLGSSSATPIFIVGMHRSGTTLLERILDGHSSMIGAGELYDFTAQMRLATDHHCRGVMDHVTVARAAQVDYSTVGRGYLEATLWRTQGQPFFIDKLPSNFLNIGFITRALPQARFLHMVRDPMDTCLSNLRELFSDACPYSYRQDEMADYYALYRRLMNHWHQVLPGRILDVPYRLLVEQPESSIRRVLQFCGLAYEPGMLAIERNPSASATASSPQIRSGIHRGGLETWRSYQEHLRPLRQRLTALGVL